jgi:excisionase family DNA binding protein
MTRNLPEILTLEEVATVLRSSKAHISKLARGKIPGVPALPVVRLGRRVIIKRDALFEWLSRQSSGIVVGAS